MKINKKKLIKALELIGKSPEEAIKWLKSTRRLARNYRTAFLCNNERHWRWDTQILYRGDKRSFARDNLIYIPKFVRLENFEMETGEWRAIPDTVLNRFSLMVCKDTQYYVQALSILEEIRDENK